MDIGKVRDWLLGHMKGRGSSVFWGYSCVILVRVFWREYECLICALVCQCMGSLWMGMLLNFAACVGVLMAKMMRIVSVIKIWRSSLPTRLLRQLQLL
jgi:hypothetical protein